MTLNLRAGDYVVIARWNGQQYGDKIELIKESQSNVFWSIWKVHMSESAPSIDPKTIAIGAAVVVAGVGAYMLLSGRSSGGDSGSGGTNIGIGTSSIPAGTVLPGETDDCPSDALIQKLEDAGGVASKIGGWPAIAGSIAARYVDKIPSMDELNSMRTDAFNAGKAAVASSNYDEANKQYGLLRGYEQLVLKSRIASFATSHQKDPFCKNPLSAQLLKLMMPMITDKLTKQYTTILDTAEANINAGHYAAARGNLFTLDQTYGFDKYWAVGGGSTESFMVPIKQRRDELMSDIDAGETRLTQSNSNDAVLTALQDPTYARLLSGDNLKAYGTILPVYQQYLAKKDDPDLDVRVAVAKAILQLPNWYANTPEMQAFISKTSAEFNSRAADQKKALAGVAGVAAAAGAVGAGLKHLLDNQDFQESAWRATVDLYFRWTPAQQKQFVDSLSPDDKKLFMNAIRRAKMDRVNNGT
jgi:hypothetical protein